MVSDDVDIIQVNDSTDKDAIEAAIQQWLDDNSAATSLDHVVKTTEKSQRVYLAMIHTN